MRIVAEDSEDCGGGRWAVVWSAVRRGTKAAEAPLGPYHRRGEGPCGLTLFCRADSPRADGSADSQSSSDARHHREATWSEVVPRPCVRLLVLVQACSVVTCGIWLNFIIEVSHFHLLMQHAFVLLVMKTYPKVN